MTLEEMARQVLGDQQPSTGESIAEPEAEVQASSPLLAMAQEVLTEPTQKKEPASFIKRSTNWKAIQEDFVQGSIRLKKAGLALAELLGTAASGAIGGPIAAAAGLADLAGSAAYTGLSKVETGLHNLFAPAEQQRQSENIWDPARAKATMETLLETLVYTPQTELGSQLFADVMTPITTALDKLSTDIVSTPVPAPLTGNFVRLKDMIEGAKEAVDVGLFGLLFALPAKGAKPQMPKGRPGKGGVGWVAEGPPPEAPAGAAQIRHMREKIWPQVIEGFQKAEEVAPSPAAKTAKAEPPPKAPVEPAPSLIGPEPKGTALEAQQLAIRKRRQAEMEAELSYRAPEVAEKPAAPEQSAPVVLPSKSLEEWFPGTQAALQEKFGTRKAPTEAPSAVKPEPPATEWRKAPYGGYSSLTPDEIAEVQKTLERGGVRAPAPIPEVKVPVTPTKGKGKTVKQLAEETLAPPKAPGPLKDAQVKSVLSKILGDDSGILHGEFLESLSDPFVRKAIDPYLVLYEALLPKVSSVREATIKELKQAAKGTEILAYYEPYTGEIALAKVGETYGGFFPRKVRAEDQVRYIKHELGGHGLEHRMDYADMALFLEQAKKMGLKLPYKYIAEHWNPSPAAYHSSAHVRNASELIAKLIENLSPGELGQLIQPVLEQLATKKRITLAEKGKFLKAIDASIKEEAELKPAFRSKTTGKVYTHPAAKTHAEVLEWLDMPREAPWNPPDEMYIDAPGVRYDGPMTEGPGNIKGHFFTDQATESTFFISPQEFAEGKEFHVLNKVQAMRENWRQQEGHEFIVGKPGDLEYVWMTKNGIVVKDRKTAIVVNRNSKVDLPDSTLKTVHTLSRILEKDPRPWPEIVQKDFAEAVKRRHVDSDGRIYVKGEPKYPTPEVVNDHIESIMRGVEEREQTVARYQELIDQGKNEDLEAVRKIAGNDSRLTTAEQGIESELYLNKVNKEYASDLDDLARAYWRKVTKEEAGSVALDALKGIYKSIAEFFAPQLGIPRSAAYLTARYKTMGSINIIEASVKKTWKELDKFDEQTKRDIFRFLDGQIPLNALPPAVQYIARQLQIKNETIGKALVKRGLLSQEAFNEHRGQYIRYMYLRHILGDERPITTSGGRLDLTYLKQRKDLTYDQRKALGLIEDVSVAEPMTLSRSLTDIVKFDFFQKVLADTDWTWQPSTVRIGNRVLGIDALADEIIIYKDMVKKDPNNPLIARTLRDMEAGLQQAITTSQGKAPEGFHRVPDSKAYGPLRGAYINAKIADDIIPVFGGVAGQTPGAGIFNAIVKMEEKSMAAFKISKTALNVPTMFRNTVSNVIQLNMSGMNLGEIPYYMEKAAVSWKNKDLEWQQARRYGLFKTNWAEGEINEVLATVKDFQPKSWFHIVDRMAPLAKFYGKIDDFFKLTKFMEQRAKGVSVETAALEAQKWGMDYSLTSPSVKLARRHIIPFGTYTYKITPLLAETMVKRPWVIAKYAALIPLSYELFQQANNIDDATWDRLYKQLPSYIKQSGSYAVLPMRNAEGHWQWINLEYFFPWQQMRQAGDHIIQQRFGELPQDVGITNPYFTILSSLAASKGDNPPIDMWTRQPIYLRVDPPKVKAQKTVEWLYSQWAPPMLTRMGALGYSASIGEQTKQRHKITPEEAALRWFGINVNAVTPAQRVSEIKGKKSLMLKELRKLYMDPSVDPDRRKEALEEYKKQMKELLQ